MMADASSGVALSSDKYQPVLDYIDGYWDKCTRKPKIWGNACNLVMHLGRVRLPHLAVSPNADYFAGTQFYWDTYFTILGLLDCGRHELAKGMVDNLLFLYDKFGLMPARNSYTSIGRTQPPYLTRMAFEVYEAKAADRKWLDNVLQIALKEYENVWMCRQRYDETTGLSRYRPKYLRRMLTVYESGWDVSARFNYGDQEIIPVDLNCQLYQYESDFLKWAKMNKDKKAEKRWKIALKIRKEQIDSCFWDQKVGFYYDNHEGKTGTLKTLAGFYPMWCGAASKEQAKRCATKLRTFEFPGGLANSEKLPPSGGRLTLAVIGKNKAVTVISQPFSRDKAYQKRYGAERKTAGKWLTFGFWRAARVSLAPRQWDYPNGWAPQQLIVCEGLLRYGYNKEAERIARKWLDCNAEVFERTGKLWEKYNVVKKRIGRRGRYPTQAGFAWTNSVFMRLYKLFGS